MAVEKSFGIPLISRVYRPNCHDSKLFSHVLAGLIVSLKALCTAETDLVLVLDKGNNSKDNFSYMKGKINRIGALVPSHHKDLIDMELSQYHGVWKDKRYYRCKKVVMSIECSIILTFNAARKRKQEHTLNRGIEKLQYDITKKWNSYKLESTEFLTLLSLLKNLSLVEDRFHIFPANSRFDFQTIPFVSRRDLPVYIPSVASR